MITNRYPGECPSCKANLVGEIIPEENRQLYASNYFYRVIGIYDFKTDRTIKWKCPDCDHEWDC